MRPKAIILLFILGFFTQIALSSTVVPFTVVNGLILVHAKVNDAEEGWFIYDTGAFDVLINGKSEYASNHFSNLNGQLSGQKVHLRSIELGNYRKIGIQAFKTDLSALESYLSLELKGILGSSFFLPREIFLDLKRQLVIIDPDYNVKDFNYVQKYKLRSTNDISYIYLPYKNGHLKLGLDSGCSSHIINEKSLTDNSIDFMEAEVNKLLTHTGQESIIRKVLTDIPIWNDAAMSLFIVKDIADFNSQLDIALDGFLSLTSLPYDFLYINKKKDFFGVGNY